MENLENKLYGRDRELKYIKDVIDENKSSLIFVSGHSGIGKTALVRNAISICDINNFIYLEGKCDQYYNDKPYAPITLALQQFLNKVFTQPKKIYNQWKEIIKREIGDYSHIVENVLPEIQVMLDKQKNIQIEDHNQTKNILHEALYRLIKLITEKYFLILFIDDLQWADENTLFLIKKLLYLYKDNNFAMIIAYRDEEFDNKESIDECNEILSESNVFHGEIKLERLSSEDSSRLIESKLSLNEEEQNITKVIYSKTLGNPFYINRLLTHLKSNMSYDCMKDYLLKLYDGDNPNDIIIKIIEGLSEKEKDLLKIMACIGTKGSLDILQQLMSISQEEFINTVNNLEKEGLIIVSDHAEMNRIESNKVYEFVHDKVYATAYEMLDKEEKKRIHYDIGITMLKRNSDKAVKDNIIYIMSNILIAVDKIKNEDKELIIIHLLMAGKNAKNQASYSLAAKYLKECYRLIKCESVSRTLKNEIILELADNEYLSKNIDSSEQLYKALINETKDHDKLATIYYRKLMLYTSSSNYENAIDAGLKSLRFLGLKLKANPQKKDLFFVIVLAMWNFRSSNIKKLSKLEENDSERIEKILKVLLTICPAASLTNPILYTQIILIIANISAKNGGSKYSGVGYTGFAFFAQNMLNNSKKARQIEELSLKAVGKFQDKNTDIIVYFILGAFVNHWSFHVTKSMDYLTRAIKDGKEVGETIFTIYSQIVLLEMRYSLGVNLEEEEKEYILFLEEAKRKNFGVLFENTLLYYSCLKALRNSYKDKNDFINSRSIDYFKSIDKANDITLLFRKAEVLFIYNEYDQALKISEFVFNNAKILLGNKLYSDIYFYHGLILALNYHIANKIMQRKYKIVLKKILKKVRAWSDNCPSNYKHKLELLKDIIYKALGKTDIEKHFDKAIRLSKENKYIKDEAISCELAGKYYMSKKRYDIAEEYINKAYWKYLSWGALNKLLDMKKEYGDVFENSIGVRNEYTDSNKEEIKREFQNHEIDNYYKNILGSLSELGKTTTSEEIAFKSLESFMKITGANRGAIFLELNDEFYLEYMIDSSKTEDKKIKVELEQCKMVPKSVIRYVSRTNESIIIDGNINQTFFYEDPYFKSKTLASIICIPINVYNVLLGIVYLEDNTSIEAFNEQSIDLFKTIISHIFHSDKIMQNLKQESNNSLEAKEYGSIDPLTKRELQILRLLAQGKSNKTISKECYIAQSTVKTHISNIYSKLGVNRRVQATIKAKELKIIP